MNIHQAIRSTKPFTHDGMIGAWCFVDGFLIHRDNWNDFMDMDWIRANCIPDHPTSKDYQLVWMNVLDLWRDDWRVVEI
jgi:hypothetical protein